MEGITTVKISDLTEILRKLSEIQAELRELKENEDCAKAYTIKQAADMLKLHYLTVRRLVISGRLYSKPLEEDSRKRIIPLRAIREYLESKENSNQ